MKRASIIALLILVFFAPFAGAVSVKAPVQIPQNIAWLFSVELPKNDSFTYAQIFYDNKLIVTTHNDSSVDIDSGNGKFILKAFINDESGTPVLYVSYIEKSKGFHTIKVLAYNNTDLVDEKNASVEIVESFSSNTTEINNLKSQINTLEDKLEKFETDISGLKSSSTSAQNSADELNSKLAAAQEEINSIKEVLGGANKSGTISLIQQKVLQDRVEALEGKITSMETEMGSYGEQIQTQKEKILSMMQAGEGNILTGFFSLGVAGIPVPLVLIITVIAIAFILIKIRKKGAV